MGARKQALLACAFIAVLTLCAPAHGALFRTYLSGTGSDANPCTLAAPCRLLPAALTAVADGGEIWMLDSGNFNTTPVNIAKSVTILAVPGVVGSVLAIGGDAIVINTAGVKVTLRNLVLVPFPGGGGTNGINMTNGAALTLEGCLIANMPQAGVLVTNAGNVRVANTTIRDNGTQGLIVWNGAKTTVTRSTISGNVQVGVYVYGHAPATTTADIAESTIEGSGTGLLALSDNASGVVKVSLRDSRVLGNSSSGVRAQSLSGASVTVSASNNLVSNNGDGLSASFSGAKVFATGNTITHNVFGFYNSSGLIETACDNAVRNNGADASGVISGTSAKTLVVSGFPGSQMTGVTGTITVAAKDACNNTVTGYAGTIHFTSSDGLATLPTDYTFVPGDAGVHVFSVTLNTVGTQSITATDTVTGTITGSQTGITVTQGPNLFGSTATVIIGGSRSGQIFIVGGSVASDGTSRVTNTWFYNPATSALTAGPTLVTARAFHTATAFGSAGQVLIAGGRVLAGGQRELELCSTDGATPACANTGGSLAQDRCNAAAILFSASRILIAGGDNCATATTTPINTWIIWDAAAPISTFSGTMISARRLHTATAVAADKALLAGGAAAASAEVFSFNSGSPGSSTSAPTTGGMNAVRSGHTATVLPQTSATTACPTAAINQCVLIAGGNSTTGGTWEIYDPVTNTFPVNASTGSNSDLVVKQRTRHAAAVFSNGKVLLAGGEDIDVGTALSTTESFDPTSASLTFSSGVSLQVARMRAANAFSASQNVLVLIGGSSQAPATEQVPSP